MCRPAVRHRTETTSVIFGCATSRTSRTFGHTGTGGCRHVRSAVPRMASFEVGALFLAWVSFPPPAARRAFMGGRVSVPARFGRITATRAPRSPPPAPPARGHQVTPRLHILTPIKLVRRKRRWWWWVAPLVLLGLTACPTHMRGQRPEESFARRLQAGVPTDSRPGVDLDGSQASRLAAYVTPYAPRALEPPSGPTSQRTDCCHRCRPRSVKHSIPPHRLARLHAAPSGPVTVVPIQG